MTSAGRAKVTDFGAARLALSTMTQAAHRPGSSKLHVAGAGQGAFARRPFGPVLRRRGVLRDDHPSAAVLGQRHRHDDVSDCPRGADAAKPVQPAEWAGDCAASSNARLSRTPPTGFKPAPTCGRRASGGRLAWPDARGLAGPCRPSGRAPPGSPYRRAGSRRAGPAWAARDSMPAEVGTDSRRWSGRGSATGLRRHALRADPGLRVVTRVGPSSPVDSGVELPASRSPRSQAGRPAVSPSWQRLRQQRRAAVAGSCWLALR